MTRRRPANLLPHLPQAGLHLFSGLGGSGVDCELGGADRRGVCVCGGRGGRRGRALYSRDALPAGRRGEAGGVSNEGRGLYGVSHSLLSRWRPEGGGWSLDISGKVERVALQLGKGDGRMLQVIQQHLDLGGEKTRWFD